MYIVATGGGNGLAKVAAAIEHAWIPDLQATFITVPIDDALHTSTGQLREKGDHLGYYGDVSRIYCELNKACWNERDWLAEKITMRLPSGIPPGLTFADLWTGCFGREFAVRGMQGPYREKAIRSIHARLGYSDIKDLKMAELFGRKLLEAPVDADNFPNHSLCNMLLFTLERIVRREGLPLSVALDAARDFYRIPDHYRVRLCTERSTTLEAEMRSGETIMGQYAIDFRGLGAPLKQPYDEVKKISLNPEVPAASDSVEAFEKADVAIISCGSIDSNVRGLFCVGGLKDALRKRANRFEKENGFPFPVVYIANLLTEPGNTLSGKRYTAATLVDVVQDAIGCRLTAVVYNTTPLSADDEKRLRPNKRLKLGDLKAYAANSSDKPFLWKREVGVKIPDKDPDSKAPPQFVHDPRKLGAVFRDILLGVHAGARS